MVASRKIWTKCRPPRCSITCARTNGTGISSPKCK
jgi:hypothetical protein